MALFHMMGRSDCFMRRAINSIFFEKRDSKLIEIVNSVYDEPKSLGYTGKLLYPFFHPLGIKELAETRGLRAAFSIVSLMKSIEHGSITSRLQALAGIKDDLVDTVAGPMPKNTARVLLQIMKDLVRAQGDPDRQIRLAHDFRIAAFGKPRIIRYFLQQYHLLEMPEEWNQITFDDHVHDANTSGRKSPTHLIMDAWIKGIRRLRVIYYHYIEPRCALELIEAARIMEIDLRIGIEFWALHREKYVSFIWVSRGLPNLEAFLSFLAAGPVVDFMEEGKALSRYQGSYLHGLLEKFNRNDRNELCEKFGICMEPLKAEEFLTFITPGQPSLEYLAEFIHTKTVQAIQSRLSQTEQCQDQSQAEAEEVVRLHKTLKNLTVKELLRDYLDSDNFFSRFRDFVRQEGGRAPDRLTIGVVPLLEQIDRLHHDYRITLNLDRLRPEDVLELLYESCGRINRIEIINLKKYNPLDTQTILCVNALQEAINQGSILKLKRIISKIIADVSKQKDNDKNHQLKSLSLILNDIDELKHMFDIRPIELRIGSDSSEKPYQSHGMGFAVIDTLPWKVRRTIEKGNNGRLILPVNAKSLLCTTTVLNRELPGIISWIPGIRTLFADKKQQWLPGPFHMDSVTKGNLLTLGKSTASKNGFTSHAPASVHKTPAVSLKYLDTRIKNACKIIIGFIPAQLCFMMTKDWWLLAYFGALIWFSITGIRNVIQSVLGGGGIKRASLLKWNDYVSWDRLADSLFYTGFSVPLLDYLVKILILEKSFGITMANGPVTLYAVMGLANGIYLSSHNFFRGLPKGAVTGNFFRSILSIPVAVALSAAAGSLLGFFNLVDINGILQKWAAIISKGASDIVAAFIEGTADRTSYIRIRKHNIRKKISDLFDIFSKLVMLFPETKELKILEDSSMLLDNKNSEVRDLATLIIINALDLSYFWMYLPRAQSALVRMVSELTPEERVIFFQSQNMLAHEHHISRLFVDGVLGKNFSRPLSFYLTSYKTYLRSLQKATGMSLPRNLSKA